MEEMVFLEVRVVRPDRRRIRSNSIIRSARSSTEYTICYIFYRLKYHIRPEVLLHILETHEFDDLRSNKECYDDHDQSDHGIADRVDRGFHFLIFASWKDEHDSSPDDEEDCTDDGYEDDYSDSCSDHISSTIVATDISKGSRCTRIWYRKIEIHKKEIRDLKNLKEVKKMKAQRSYYYEEQRHPGRRDYTRVPGCEQRYVSDV